MFFRCDHKTKLTPQRSRYYSPHYIPQTNSLQDTLTHTVRQDRGLRGYVQFINKHTHIHIVICYAVLWNNTSINSCYCGMYIPIQLLYYINNRNIFDI